LDVQPSEPLLSLEEPCESELLAGLECTDLTQEERDLIVDDALNGILWWDPLCASIGISIIAHVQSSQKMQKFVSSSWDGAWNNFNGVQRLFFNSRFFSGAPPWWERQTTVLHEGAHLFFQSGSEAMAQYFEYFCYNN